MTDPKKYKKQLSAISLSHEGIMELMTLLQNAGFFSMDGRVTSKGIAYLLGEN